jgi:hypothetical protein
MGEAGAAAEATEGAEATGGAEELEPDFWSVCFEAEVPIAIWIWHAMTGNRSPHNQTSHQAITTSTLGRPVSTQLMVAPFKSEAEAREA